MPKKVATSKSKTVATRSSSIPVGLVNYHKFAKAERAKIKKEHPDFDKQRIQKLLSTKWAASSENPKNQKKEDED